jgi:hypothetical protein
VSSAAFASSASIEVVRPAATRSSAGNSEAIVALEMRVTSVPSGRSTITVG